MTSKISWKCEVQLSVFMTTKAKNYADLYRSCCISTLNGRYTTNENILYNLALDFKSLRERKVVCKYFWL